MTDDKVIGLALSLVQDIGDLIANSEGVAGLHMNGDVAPWESLTEGGEFGAWLGSFDRLRDALDARGAPGRMPAADVAAQERMVSAFAPLAEAITEADEHACGCRRCAQEEVARTPSDDPFDPRMMRMFLCGTCGNKRCPRAVDHRNDCSGSNEPGQKGSDYEDAPVLPS